MSCGIQTAFLNVVVDGALAPGLPVHVQSGARLSEFLRAAMVRARSGHGQGTVRATVRARSGHVNNGTFFTDAFLKRFNNTHDVFMRLPNVPLFTCPDRALTVALTVP